jgi:NADPH:quinone reductase-like Zn-dependent oxidoreductase
MRVVEIPRPGPPEVLRLRQRPDPEPSDGRVLVRVRAAGVNFADLMGRAGLYPDAPPYPYVPGYEVAGVEAATGRRVIASTRFGGYASLVLASPRRLVELPEGLGFEEGAALPVNYLTAWVALMEMARVRAGETVLVHSAAGGVGIAAVQIARRFGARVVGVVGTEEKAAFLRGCGVEPVVRPAPVPQADVILDPRAPGAWKDSVRRLKPGGRVVLYGAQEFVVGPTRNLVAAAWKLLRTPRPHPARLMNANVGIFGLNLLHLLGDDAMIGRGLDGILGGVRDGWVRPVVARAFPLERAAEAHAFLHERRNIGKVVLIP